MLGNFVLRIGIVQLCGLGARVQLFVFGRGVNERRWTIGRAWVTIAIVAGVRIILRHVGGGAATGRVDARFGD